MQDTNLSKYIKIYKKSLSYQLCNKVIKSCSPDEWRVNGWYFYTENKDKQNDFDPHSQFIFPKHRLIINQNITKCCKLYSKEFNFGFTFLSTPKINRYTVNQKMLSHVDHIQSLFDGTNKGIPIFSTITCMNDDYEGGELIFWDDYTIELGIGDTVIFPSNFLFRHRINEILNGTRYSCIIWGW